MLLTVESLLMRGVDASMGHLIRALQFKAHHDVSQHHSEHTEMPD